MAGHLRMLINMLRVNYQNKVNDTDLIELGLKFVIYFLITKS